MQYVNPLLPALCVACLVILALAVVLSVAVYRIAWQAWDLDRLAKDRANLIQQIEAMESLDAFCVVRIPPLVDMREEWKPSEN